MRLGADEAWERLVGARSGTLVTLRSDGSPVPVPFVFATLPGRRLLTAIDRKPKSTRTPARLARIRDDPRVAVLVDHYDDDWERLWWVRGDGVASIVETPPPGSEALVARYAAYRRAAPPGPWIEIDLQEVTGWSAR